MTPTQLQALRDSLPPLVGLGLVPAELPEYCRFYHIDFERTMPGVQHRIGTVESGPHTLAVQCWQQPGATANLLLVHGYFDHAGLYGKLIEFGLQQNCNVMIFDLPGHGLSSGEPVAIDDFGDYAAALGAALGAARLLPELPLWVMAQSTGCAALVEYARRQPWPFAAAVMLAPLLRPKGWTMGRVSHVLAKPFTASIKRKFAVNSSDTEFLDFVRRDPLQSQRLSLAWVTALKQWLAALPLQDLGVGPVLIVQGDADKTVDWRFNIEGYRKLFPDSQVEILPGAGHQLANESLEMRRAYLTVVATYLQAVGVLPDQSVFAGQD